MKKIIILDIFLMTILAGCHVLDTYTPFDAYQGNTTLSDISNAQAAQDNSDTVTGSFATIKGHIYDAGTSSAISGATVTATGNYGGDTYSTTTGSDGAYSLKVSADSWGNYYTLSASASGHILTSYNNGDSFELVEGDTKENADIYLMKTMTLTMVQTYNFVLTYARDIECDGTYLWVTDYYSSSAVTIYCLDKNTCQIDHSFNISDIGLLSGANIGYYNGYLYINGPGENAQIRVYDYFGNLQYTITKDDNEISSIVYYEGYLWCTAYRKNQIYKIDMSGNTVYTLSYPVIAWSIAVKGSSFYLMTDTDKIQKYNPATYSVVAETSAPSPDGKGIATDGTYFWVVDSVQDKIYKFTLSE